MEWLLKGLSISSLINGKVDSPPACLDPSLTNGVVVKGVVYFFFDQWQFEEPYINDCNIEFGCMPSFNI
jgi:hypothetical protein